jgi:heme-degrading monooxygenase HmoA
MQCKRRRRKEHQQKQISETYTDVTTEEKNTKGFFKFNLTMNGTEEIRELKILFVVVVSVQNGS